MDKDALLRTLRVTFAGELEDQARAMQRDLLALERNSLDRDRVQALLRAAHTVKGAARAVSLDAVEALAHEIETSLVPVRDTASGLGAGLRARLLAAVDAFALGAQRLSQGQEPDAALLDAARASLSSAAPSPAAPGIEGPAVPEPKDTAPVERPPTAHQDGALRVAAVRLDTVMRHASELRLARVRLGETMATFDEVCEGAPPQMERPLARFGESLFAGRRALERAARALEGEVYALRTVSFKEATEGLERTLYDVAAAAQKHVGLVLQGGEVGLDRAVAAGLRAPLVQLVRNAVDHAFEPAAVRRAAGKPARGTLTIGASLRGSVVEITVEDDGRGLDIEAIRAAAVARSIDVPEDVNAIHGLIFRNGLSTARSVTQVSGRGIGLDVVRDALEAVHGTVSITSVPGRGVRFTLTVPLTLGALRGVIVLCGGRRVAIAATNVERVLRVSADDVRRSGGREVVRAGKDVLPIVALGGLLGAHEVPFRATKAPALVVAAADRRIVFAVDEVQAEGELVVKGLGKRALRARDVAGSVLLPDGKIALLLNAASLVRRALGERSTRRAIPVTAKSLTRKRVLLAEDSVTTRTLEKTILEAAGYEVIAVADGEEAWRRLQDVGADVVVSDVEMPRLDGLALTTAIRASKRFHSLPVILVTARSGDDERARGAEAGADAYLVKSSFDQALLLETLAQLLGPTNVKVSS